jgi:Beta-lactamase
VDETRRAYRIGDGVTDNPVVLGPAGTIHMNLADLLTYLAAHRDGASFLSARSWRTLHTPPFGGDYAMGWVVRPDGYLWHNGSNTLWYAEAEFNNTSGVAAAAAANDGYVAKSTPAVSRALGAAAAAA